MAVDELESRQIPEIASRGIGDHLGDEFGDGVLADDESNGEKLLEESDEEEVLASPRESERDGDSSKDELNFLPLHASNDPENHPETFLNCQMDGNPLQPPIKLVRSYQRHPAPQVIPVIDLAPLTSLPSGVEVGVAEEFDSTRTCSVAAGVTATIPFVESDTGTSITVYGTVAASNLPSQPIWSFAVDGPVMSTYTPHDNIRRAPPGALDVAVLVHHERLSPARGPADASARMSGPILSVLALIALAVAVFDAGTATLQTIPVYRLRSGSAARSVARLLLRTMGSFAIPPDPHSSSNVATAGVSHNDPDSPNSASGSHRNASPMPSTSYPSVSHHAPPSLRHAHTPPPT
ncbi:hypothetical protein B0H14DRAFT_3152643 [Mycena olivaceomarginata]|nr:hypothetical protein B0H14DRAFT_3152643 [Mycena olivaceomarginata]